LFGIRDSQETRSRQAIDSRLAYTDNLALANQCRDCPTGVDEIAD
jgi:hypothetical protein